MLKPCLPAEVSSSACLVMVYALNIAFMVMRGHMHLKM